MPIAHIGHAELRVTNLERSRWFFTELMGLHVSAEEDDRVYLRAWQDWDHHTLVLVQAEDSGLEHVAWRVSAPEDLADYERRLKRLGIESHWVEGQLGHGDALRFRTPAGLPFELYWEVERYLESSPDRQSRLPSHPMRYTGKGMAPRRFDHVNCLIDDPGAEQDWLTSQLGIHHRYYVTSSGGQRLGSWLSRTNVSHEIALMRNKDQSGSLLHHVGYFVDSPDQLIRSATILADHDIKLEWGPGAHGTSGAIFLYCIEPSGNRIEVWTGGFLIFAPDWEPIAWDPQTSPLGLEMWGSQMPDTYLTYGTPVRAATPLTAAATA